MVIINTKPYDINRIAKKVAKWCFSGSNIAASIAITIGAKIAKLTITQVYQIINIY